MKLLKISIYALCLSTMVGISTMAMENGKQNISAGRQVQAVSDKDEKVMDEKRLEEVINDEMSQGKSERYSKFYADLIVKGKLDEAAAREQAIIFEKEVASGKSFIYAQYYSMLIVMRKVDTERAMFQSEVFEREFKTHKNFKKADYYATNIILHDFKRIKLDKLKEDLFAMIGSGKKMLLIEKILELLKNDIESGKSYDYLNKRMRSRFINYYCAISYENLRKIGKSDEVARQSVKIVREEMEKGRNCDYAMSYAELIMNGQPEEAARRGVKIIEEEIKKGNSGDYIMSYVDLIVMGGKSKEEAMKIAKIVEREMKKGRSYYYATGYAESISMGQSEKKAREMAEIIEEETKEGK